jgi:hypothetical protein
MNSMVYTTNSIKSIIEYVRDLSTNYNIVYVNYKKRCKYDVSEENLCPQWCGCCAKCILEFDGKFLPIAQHYKHNVGDVLIPKE